MFRIQPDLRFPRFKEPWKKIVLGDISKRPMYGVGASAVEFNNKDVYVRITDIEDKSRKLMSRNFTSPSIVNEKYLLKDKDILFARTGASTGKTYIHENYELKYDYYFAGFLIKFEILKSYYPDFIYQYTLTNSYENWVKVMSVRSGQPGINSEEYSKLKLNIPRYEEQKKIGDFFSKLDRQIELEEQKLAKLEEQKKGYMQQIFSRQFLFENEKGDTDYSWRNFKIKDIFSKIESGNRLPKTNLVEGNIPYVIAQTTNNGVFMHISEDTLDYHKNKLKLFKKGSITISIDNPEAMFIQEMDFFTSNVMRVIHNENLKRGSHIFIMESLKKLTQSYNWSVKFSGPIIMDSTVKFPVYNDNKVNWNVVNKIGDFFNTFEIRINRQSDKIKLLEERKKGLLQKMFV
ncbi:restriction endonuclease subunit S [Staphylococcus shinii]|uniref:Restriction endonuclease subunit S n=1 Tax=Candidatus Coprosoma intestinipullorum TaxID=2840752 RepID=A0A9D1CY33_9FIRM|nr:restriction endonuclease subunit S [Candidatus Coprosoma intestinipullorum]